MSKDSSYDREKAVENEDTEVSAVEVAPDQVIAKRFGIFGPLLSKLFKSGVEARGVERVPENQRETKNSWNKSVPPHFCYIQACAYHISQSVDVVARPLSPTRYSRRSSMEQVCQHGTHHYTRRCVGPIRFHSHPTVRPRSHVSTSSCI